MMREKHLELLDVLRKEKKCLYAARLEGENNKPIGSVMIFDFPSRQELEKALAEEPYVKNKVWEKIGIIDCVTADMFKRN